MSIHGNFDFSKVTIYLVGGAVRDYFMGIEPKDKDYVVVGSSPEEMVSLGFQKVGADFPVFLHPKTKDEYALARTERKSGTGYNGFDCEWDGVTIEEDLSRRDLTINSIALDCTKDFGKVIDPFKGRQDIEDKILRHTSKAFEEDSVRVLRIARFLARFGQEWTIHKETSNIMDAMYEKGDLDDLTSERVWKETEKALSEKTPSLYFNELLDYDIFSEYNVGYFVPQKLEHHPEEWVGTHTDLVMKYAAKTWNDPEITFACLCHDFGKVVSHNKHGNFHGHEKEGLQPINNFCDKWKVPKCYRNLALLVCEFHTKNSRCIRQR